MDKKFDVTKHIVLGTGKDYTNKLELIGKALSSKERIRILDLLKVTWLPMNDIAKTFDMPISTVSFHLDYLERAGLIISESRKGKRGKARVSTCVVQDINIFILEDFTDEKSKIISSTLPIGSFTDCYVEATCGLCNEKGPIGLFDSPRYFYDYEKFNAQLIWFRNGFIEYKFPNHCIEGVSPRELSFSLELCSEAHGSNSNWPSNILIYVNGVLLGKYVSPGDFGDRKGLYTPEFWVVGNTQYGLLKNFSLKSDGFYIDNELVNKNISIENVDLFSKPFISFKLVVDDSEIIGGINIFGKKFGDYPQDINMNIFY